MRSTVCYRTALSLAILLASPAFADSDDEGFIDGTRVHVLNRNF